MCCRMSQKGISSLHVRCCQGNRLLFLVNSRTLDVSVILLDCMKRFPLKLINRFPNSSQYVYRWSKDLDIKLRKLCGNSFGITLRRWDGEFLTTFMREPEPGELPIKVENGSSSERPLYDIGRGDLHIA